MRYHSSQHCVHTCLLEQSFDHEIHMSFRTDDTSVSYLNSYANHKHKQLFIRGPGGHIQLRLLLLLWHHSTLCLQSTANYPVMYVPSTIHTRRRACGELVLHPTALYMLLLAEKLSALTLKYHGLGICALALTLLLLHVSCINTVLTWQ